FKDGGRGIVMCVGNYHAKFAMASIKSIRAVHRSTLPIEIYYTGEQDLDKSFRDWFERLDNVKTIDLTTKVNNSLIKIEGWTAKPFAMMVSRFEEVLLMDSDAYFFRDPETLFKDPGYINTGALFFY